MELNELQNRLTNIITDIEGIEQTAIEYYTRDEEKDGPIPGIKLFKDLNIYLEREFCEY